MADKAKASQDELTRYKKLFDAARDDMADGRKDSDLSRDFYDLKQWTPEEKHIIESRGQVPIVVSKFQRAIDGIRGVVESNKTDPRALMRNPPDDNQTPQMGAGPSPSQTLGPQGPALPSAAPQQQQPKKKPLDPGDIATMTLRAIADTTHFKSTTKMDVLENMLVEGCGAGIVEVDEKLDVTITHIRWEEYFYDPKSRRFDFKDAKFMGVAKWIYAEDLKALYPESKTDIDNIMGDGAQGLGLDPTFDDRPDSTTGRQPWLDRKDQRVMVVDMYHLDGGTWNRCVFFTGGVLQSGPSEYQDDDGRPCCPIEGGSCYINRKNERYGVAKSMRDPQKEINMRRSKALHEINSRQIQQADPSAPPVDVEVARKEANDPNGVMPSGWQVVPRQDIANANIEMMREAQSELDRLAAAPAVLARQGADASGRAQQIRVQTGMQELAPVLGRHKSWERRMYIQCMWRVRQFWTAEKIIRVTHELDAPEYIKLNEPVIDPATGQLVGTKNEVAKMDVDIVLDETPDTATLEQEIFSEFVELAKVYGPQAVPLELLLEMSSISKKREIINKLEDLKAQAAPQQQMAMQAQMAKFQAELAEIKSTIRKNDSQSDLNEATTVKTAMDAHLDVTQRAQLPQGVILNGSGTPVPVTPPPPKTSAGPSQSSGSHAAGNR